MTPSRAQAIGIVEQFPEEHLSILIQNLQYLRSMYVSHEEQELTKSMQAFQNLQKYRKESTKQHNYTDELSDILEERYESLSRY